LRQWYHHTVYEDWTIRDMFRLWPGPVRVFDARDKRVPLFNPGSPAAIARAEKMGLDPATPAQARRSVWRSISGVGWGALAFRLIVQLVAIGLGLQGMMYMAHSRFSKPWDWVWPGITVFCLMWGVLFLWSEVRRTHASSLARG